jgi:hypothetical protein
MVPDPAADAIFFRQGRIAHGDAKDAGVIPG